MNQPQRPDPEPLKTNDQAAILVGTGVWAIALVVLLIFPPAPDRWWWAWTCVAGIVGGLFGIWFVRHMKKR